MTSERGRFVTGLVIGLLAGLTVALAVALYITKAPVPFVNKVPQRGPEQDAAEAERNKNWDPNAPLAGKAGPRPPAAVLPQSTPAASGPLATLPPAGGLPAPAPTFTPTSAPTPAPVIAGAAPATGSAAAASAAARSAPRDPAAILAGQPAAAAPRAASAAVTSTVFFVQAGAYARTEDAEQQRARLAMMGLTARVTEREQSGRTVYRVRLGPFDGRDEAEDQQGKLSAAGIDANLVRVER